MRTQSAAYSRYVFASLIVSASSGPSPEDNALWRGAVRSGFVVVTTAFSGTKSAWREFTKEITDLGPSSMASADEYYEYVEQCIALASKCLHPGDRVRLLQMAKAWRELAEKLYAIHSNPAATSRSNPAAEDSA